MNEEIEEGRPRTRFLFPRNATYMEQAHTFDTQKTPRSIQEHIEA